ncbi:hypothetical protein [Longitalea luteola]|uniref:hypothetical protein n=1 Tax=Longitalea luteola TaxID=2812563 RepID=UPI001A966992|nr:hypothetical protein [Longitalea luteola]
MKLQKHLTVCIWALLAACSSADKSRMPPIGDKVAVNAPETADEAFNRQPAGTILDFLKWYRSNVKQLKKIEMVKHSSHPDSSRYYVMNDAGTEQYLDALKRSGFVSDTYITNWRAYFTKCNDNLHKAPQTEAPVQGLDFDLVMLAKEYEEDLARIEKTTVEYVSVADDKGSITVGLPTAGRLKYRLSKQDGKWLIDDIKDLRSALDQAQND